MQTLLKPMPCGFKASKKEPEILGKNFVIGKCLAS